MRRALLLGAALAVGLVSAAVAFAAAGEDDYDYPTTTTTTGTTTTSPTVTGDDDVVSFRTALGSRAEVPRPVGAANAAGTFSATVTERRGKATIRWTLTFRRLSGPAVAAHIHRGRAGVAGPVVVALCGPCRSGQTGTRVVDEDVARPFGSRFYVNVHTAKNSAGEIRGQLKLLGK